MPVRRGRARLRAAPARRLEAVETSLPVSSAACAQDDADLVLHRAAVARRAQPQQLLQLVVELPDGEAGHGVELP